MSQNLWGVIGEITTSHYDSIRKMHAYCEEWQKLYWKAARELAELKGEVYVPDWREEQQ